MKKLNKQNKGLFITFEGGEGSGKTSLINSMYDFLTTQNLKCIKTLEPGGTQVGQRIRNLLLEYNSTDLSSKAEFFLFLADRAHHIERVIKPALKNNSIVLCDRYNDSTIAYQGAARNLDIDKIKEVSEYATSGLLPDLTFYLDIDPKIGLQRARNQTKPDRLEKESLAFHEEVRSGFLEIALQSSERVKTIDAGLDKSHVLNKALIELEKII